MALLLEKPCFGKQGIEVSVIPRNLGNVEILEVIAGEEFVEIFPGGAGMESDECIGYVLAGQIEEGDIAAGVIFGPIGDVVDFALD